MAVVYFDASAFVKLVVNERGSDLAAGLWDGADAVASSRLGDVEVRAALAAAARAGRLGGGALPEALAVWERYWSSTRPIELTDQVTAHAGELAVRYALRGADAVHLAGACAIGPDAVVLAVWDRRLRDGAVSAGIRVVPAAID